MSDLGLGALSRDRLIARIEALEAALAAEVNAPARVRLEARIEALEAELAAAKTINREVLYRENDELRALNDKLRDDVKRLMGAPERYWEQRWRDEHARIEALEAALRPFAVAHQPMLDNWNSDTFVIASCGSTKITVADLGAARAALKNDHMGVSR